MNLIYLCIEIFFARILDVSIGVVSTIELIKNHTSKAVTLAFFEVFIWFIVAREAIKTDEVSIFIALAYSLGYAAGTWIGSFLSNKFIKGTVSVQVITKKINDHNILFIKRNGYGISSINIDNHKKLLIIEVDNKKLNNLLKIIKKIDNQAFITISETKYVENGYVK